MRPDCNECGEPLAEPFTSCKCGWRAIPSKRDGNPFRHGVKVGAEWIDKGCAWNDHGEHCDRYGHMSTGTIGTGPWYCRDHFADLMRWTRYKVEKNLPLKEAA